MATYDNAAYARELIHRVARLNNQTVRTLNDAVALRAQLIAMDQAQQDAVRAAVQDMGYDDTEIVAILTDLAAVKATADAQGLAEVPAP